MNLEKFNKFSTSSNVDGNYVGLLDDEIIRIIERDKELYKSIILNQDQYKELIQSEIIEEDQNRLYVKHTKLKNITYYIEWTYQQKVKAALTTILFQKKLSSMGYYLNDPHTFNITYNRSVITYFDLGSIKKGKVVPSYWFFIKFLGRGSIDYWGNALNIKLFKSLYHSTIMLINSNPFNYIEKVLLNSLQKRNLIRNAIFSIIHNVKKIWSIFGSKGKKSSAFRDMLIKKTKVITNWTDYNQKPIDQILKEDRTISYIHFLYKYRPEKLLDIGGNKGIFSRIALSYDVKEAICIDLDENALDTLQEDINIHNLPIWTVNMDIMNYNERPASNQNFYSAHQRFNCDFAICFALVHHICYFGHYSFDEFSSRIDKFVNKSILIEFIPYSDKHLTGTYYNGVDKMWYTQENFISSFKRHFEGPTKIYKSTPGPRILIEFTKAN